MNFFLQILFPRLSRAIHRLGQVAGMLHPTQHYTNAMSRLTSSEEIAIIEGAARVITSQKQSLAELLAAVNAAGPALAENAELKAALAQAEAEDAASDAALAALADLLPKAPAENPPVVEPEVPAGVDPIDPPADPAAEEGETGSENPPTAE